MHPSPIRSRACGRTLKGRWPLTKQCLDLLTALVKARLKRMQYRPSFIEGLIAKSGLDLQLQ